MSRGNSPISRFLWKNEKKFEKELENLKLVESTLDGLIKTCAQQLFDMTDDTTNTAYPLTSGFPEVFTAPSWTCKQAADIFNV